ncbi:hypothetical protein [Flaviaesturariibacter amylovorans]|uniref:Uncharacterized protein n=1 Tax=Flaviaesturariibacter amylovorans TaxID=1084520 RepID=A0ABP8HAW8_9BACT
MNLHRWYEGMDLPTLKLLFEHTKKQFDQATSDSKSHPEITAIYRELKEIQYRMSMKEIEVRPAPDPAADALRQTT